jgi:hypothetical protein
LRTRAVARRLLIITPLVVGLILVGIFMPARQLTIEGFGTISFETAVTLSVGSQAAYASPGWLSGWSYCKSHVILAASGAGTDYQVKVIAHYGSGTDSGENFYLNGDCRPDFGDVRFTDDDGTTLLDYFMEEKVDSNYAIFWVEVADDLSTSDQTICIYYGNAAASSISDGDATFIFFDHFLGSSLDGSKWGWWSASISVSGSVVTITNTGSWGGISSNSQYSLPYNFVARAQKTTTYGIGQVGLERWYTSDGDDTINVFDVWGSTRPQVYYTSRHGASDQWDEVGTWNLNTWYHYQIKGTTTEVRYYRNGTLRNTETDTNSIPTGPMYVLLSSEAFGDRLRVDYCFIGKYVSPEPGHGAWEDKVPDISNSPSSKNFGTVAENSDYWSNDSTPTFPLEGSECYFTITNNSSGAVDISIRATDFGGGDGWNLAGSPGTGSVTLKAGQEGDNNEGDMVTLTNSDQAFISGLAASASKAWELKLETGTFTDSAPKTATITLTATFA